MCSASEPHIATRSTVGYGRHAAVAVAWYVLGAATALPVGRLMTGSAVSMLLVFTVKERSSVVVAAQGVRRHVCRQRQTNNVAQGASHAEDCALCKSVMRRPAHWQPKVNRHRDTPRV